MKYKKILSASVNGRSKKYVKCPIREECVLHPELGLLYFETKEGNIIAIRSYAEYKKEKEE